MQSAVVCCDILKTVLVYICFIVYRRVFVENGLLVLYVVQQLEMKNDKSFCMFACLTILKVNSHPKI
jgi:hypothetical protein